MSSPLFPHRIIEEKSGFVFLVSPADENDADAVVAAEGVEAILKEAWPTAPSQLTVNDVKDPEEAELILLDAIQLLEEAECAEANQLLVTGVVIVGELAVVSCVLAGEDIEDDEDDEDDDSIEASEDEFE